MTLIVRVLRNCPNESVLCSLWRCCKIRLLAGQAVLGGRSVLRLGYPERIYAGVCGVLHACGTARPSCVVLQGLVAASVCFILILSSLQIVVSGTNSVKEKNTWKEGKITVFHGSCCHQLDMAGYCVWEVLIVAWRTYRPASLQLPGRLVALGSCGI